VAHAERLPCRRRHPGLEGQPERKVGDFATVGVAVYLDRSGSSVTRAGIALTGVGGTNIKVPAAEQVLVRGGVDDHTIGEAARLAAEVAKPQTDQRGSAEYKRHLVSTFVTRALQTAIGREPIDIRQRRFENVGSRV